MKIRDNFQAGLINQLKKWELELKNLKEELKDNLPDINREAKKEIQKLEQYIIDGRNRLKNIELLKEESVDDLKATTKTFIEKIRNKILKN